MNDDAIRMVESALLDAAELKRRGQYWQAFQRLHEAALQRFAALGKGIVKLTPLDLLLLEHLADLAVLFDKTEAAEDLLTGIGLWYERAGNRYFADYFAVKRAHLALDCGRLMEAHELLRAMAPGIGELDAIEFSEPGLIVWEQRIGWADTEPLDRMILFSRLYLEMGRVLASYGQYRESLAAIGRGLAHATEAPVEIASEVAPHLRIARATALLEQGELDRARICLDELCEELSDGQRPGLHLRQLELRGKLGLLTGELGLALEQFRLALRTCAEFGFAQAAMVESLNLAHVLIYLNQTAAAHDILDEIRNRAAAMQDRRSVVRAAFLWQLAEARGHSLAEGAPIAPSVSESWGVIADTQPAAPGREAVDPFDLPQSDDFLTFFEDRALGFHWFLGRRDFDGAAAYLDEITQVFDSSDSALIGLRLQTMRAMLAYYRRDLRRAGLMFDELRHPLRERGLKPDLWQAQRFLGWCWTRLEGHEGRARQELEATTRQLLDDMSASLAPADQAIFRLNKWTAEEEMLASEIHALAALKAKREAGSILLRPVRQWRLMKRLHRLLERIDEHKDILTQRSLGASEPQDSRAKSRSLWRRLLMHPRDRVTLSFLVLPDQVFVARAGWLTLDFGICPLTRLQVRDRVRRWHELIRRALGGSRGLGALSSEPRAAIEDCAREGAALAAQLADSLQIPLIVASLPRRIRALTIVPDDSLHGFPFAALAHEGRYLIERLAVSLAFESRPRKSAARRNKGIEGLFACVSRGSRPGLAEEIHPLPGAPAELDAITAWFGRHHGRAVRLDDSKPDCAPASKAALLELLPRAGLFHIACHGIFKADAPDRSGLVLVPRPDEAEVLDLRELSGLRLARLRHATLSSCWSADHFILPGRWVISLPETLWRAGAGSILGSLWVVNDELATEFMRRFYGYLDEHPRDEALRRAQLDCLHDPAQSEVFYWAGFNLYGDSTRLRIA